MSEKEEIKMDEHAIKRDAEKIEKEIQKYAKREAKAYEMLKKYSVCDAYDIISLYHVRNKSEYVARLSYTADIFVVYDKFYDLQYYANDTVVDKLMLSKNKSEFLQNYEEYIKDLEERVKCEKEEYRKTKKKKIEE